MLIIQNGDNNLAIHSCTNCPQQLKPRVGLLRWLHTIFDLVVNAIRRPWSLV